MLIIFYLLCCYVNFTVCLRECRRERGVTRPLPNTYWIHSSVHHADT